MLIVQLNIMAASSISIQYVQVERKFLNGQYIVSEYTQIYLGESVEG